MVSFANFSSRCYLNRSVSRYFCLWFICQYTSSYEGQSRGCSDFYTHILSPENFLPSWTTLFPPVRSTYVLGIICHVKLESKMGCSYHLCLRHVSRTCTLPSILRLFLSTLQFKSSNCKFIVIIGSAYKTDFSPHLQNAILSPHLGSPSECTGHIQSSRTSGPCCSSASCVLFSLALTGQ